MFYASASCQHGLQANICVEGTLYAYLNAVDDLEAPVVVQGRNVARVQPPLLVDRLLRLLGVYRAECLVNISALKFSVRSETHLCSTQ